MPGDWERIWDSLTAEGWQLEREREFVPMLGRSWKVRACHAGRTGPICVEGPTLKIALKKMEAAIRSLG
jgi:hypothetical protein